MNWRPGATAKAIGTRVEQRFAYPVNATFPVMPLGLPVFAPPARSHSGYSPFLQRCRSAG